MSEIKLPNVGGHYYPGCVDDDNFYTSDCAYGCGCWMGGTRSGGPDGIDPFGDCPNNPPQITALEEKEADMDNRYKAILNEEANELISDLQDKLKKAKSIITAIAIRITIENKYTADELARVLINMGALEFIKDNEALDALEQQEDEK